jgi:formylglycine-generating enzyme required for sulfatase activity
MPRSALVISFALAGFLLATPVSAVGIHWVEVGDPGNACDTQAQGCFGAVAYTYVIGKYEVTNAQYAEFLNAVADADPNALYNTLMASDLGGIARIGSSGSYSYGTIAGRETNPVNYVSFYDSLRFANWLENGQPTGAQDSTTTEDGAYTMITESYPGGPFITPNVGVTFFLPNEDEWYKAAYYDPISTSYNPYPFADGFNGAVCEAPAGATTHSANCSDPLFGNTTDVGAYTTSPSAYGTFDQGGNVHEWTEAIISTGRGLRGGGWPPHSVFMAASTRSYNLATEEDGATGFRVAAVPEPGRGLLLMTGVLSLAACRRLRA